MEAKINYNYSQMIREIKATFECKIHNSKYSAYCATCRLNICEKCLRPQNNSPHIGHQIFYFSKIILSEKYTKYYQTLYFFSKYYLNSIRDIVIELLSDLNDINIKEKKLILGIKSQLKNAYKFFYKMNSYQMHYAKFILSTYLNCKKLGYFNYQIIQNVYSLKINSVRIPDLDDKDVINKVKMMIDFLKCNKNNNNILKACNGDLPDTVYSYIDYNTLKNPKINVYSVKPPSIDIYVKKGEIYEPKDIEIDNENINDDDIIENNNNEHNEKENDKNNINNDIKVNNNKNDNNEINNEKDEKKDTEKEEKNKKNVEINENKINDNNNNNNNSNINSTNNKINNNSVNSENNQESTTAQKANKLNNIINIKNIQNDSKKISNRYSHKSIEEFKSKSTPPTQNFPTHILSNSLKSESIHDSLIYTSHLSKYEFEEEIRSKLFDDTNKDLKKLIYDTLSKNSDEEVEYKDKVQYIYHDKNTNEDIICYYFGEFKKNTKIRHGRGLFIWKDGESYFGYWANDKREGEGTNTYANGNIYQGCYRNGKKEGFGVYKWKNGDLYSGMWKNDMKDGNGLYKFANGDIYDGIFKNDKINGRGVYTWKNKIEYTGQFKDNIVEKNGILRYTLNKENEDNIHKNKDNIKSEKENFKCDDKNEMVGEILKKAKIENINKDN